MSWIQSEMATPGKYVRVSMINGWYVDLFGAYTQAEVLQRVREYAQGWDVIDVRWQRGVSELAIR